MLRPTALDGFERGEVARKLFAQAREEVERLLQVVQLVHHVQPREVRHPIRSQARLVVKPFAQRLMSRRSCLVNAAARPALRFRASAAKQTLAFEILQRGINLAQFGSPEIMNALIEDGF